MGNCTFGLLEETLPTTLQRTVLVVEAVGLEDGIKGLQKLMVHIQVCQQN
jgi:hypothetical protein